MLIESSNFVIARAQTAHSRTWVRQDLNFLQFLDLFSYHRPDKKKDGIAFVAGALNGTERKAYAMLATYFAVYDIDGAQPYDEVRDIFNSKNIQVIMYTTYSHLKTTTYIKTDKFVQWCVKNGIDVENVPIGQVLHTQENVEKYAVDNKIDKKINGPFTVDERLAHTEEGMQICLRHAPIEKFRVLIPLKSPFVFAANGYTSAEQSQNWKRTYVGIGETLGLKFDMACADPSHIYYFPSHPILDDGSSAPHRLDHLIDPQEIDGVEVGREMLCYTKYPKGDIPEPSRRSGGANILATGDTLSREGSGYSIRLQNNDILDLDKWWKANARDTGLSFHAVLEHRAPEIFRGQETPEKNAEGMWHIECPFEEYHTDAGGTGCFFHTNGGEGFPRVHCMHNSCKEHRNEDFFARMIEQGWIQPSDLALVNNAKTLGGEAFVVGQLQGSDRLSVKPADPAVPALPVSMDRNTILGDIERIRAAHGTLSNKLLEYLSAIEHVGEYEMFWRKHANNFNLNREAGVDIYLLACTIIPFSTIRLYYKENMERLTLRLSELEQVIEQVRRTMTPIENRIEAMIQQRLRNTDLESAVKKAAAYYNVTPSYIKGEYDKKFAGHSNEVEAEIRAAAQEFNRKYAKLQEGKELYYIDLEHWNETGKISLITEASLVRLYSNHNYTLDYGEEKPKRVNLVKYWANDIPDHKTYKGRVFDPTLMCPPNMFNTFAGFNQVKPIPGDWGLVADHLKSVWCRDSSELFNWLMTFMANIVQQPGKKHPTGVAIIGSQGTGKSIILEHGLLPVIAPYGRISSKRDDLTNKFNSVFLECLVYVGEESVFAGDHTIMQKIKAYLSGDAAEFELKGREASSERLFTRFFFTSNDEHALRLEPGDRRFLVLEASNKHIRDVAYFEGMRRWFDTVGHSHFMHALQTWNPEAVDMKWTDLNDAPITNVKLRQIRLSQEPPKRFFLDLLTYGSIVGVVEDRLEMGNILWPLDTETYVPLRKLNACLRDYLAANGNKNHDKDKLQFGFETVVGTKWHEALSRRRPSEDAVTEVICVRLPPRREVVEAQRGKLLDEQECEIALGMQRVVDNSTPKEDTSDADADS